MGDSTTQSASAGYCQKCLEQGRRIPLSSDGRCPDCNWEPKNAGGYIGGLTSIPVALPILAIGEATDSPKVTRFGESKVKTSAAIDDEIGPPIIAASVGAVLFVGAKRLWKWLRADVKTTSQIG